MNPPLPWAITLAGIRFDEDAAGFGQQALTDLLDHVPVALAVSVGEEGRYVFANRVARSILEARAGDVIGRTVPEVMGEFLCPDVQAKRRRLLETGEPQDLAGLVLPAPNTGEPRHWDVRLLPVLDLEGHPCGILTIGIDVTAEVQARAEAEAKARETAEHTQRLALAVEATELGLWEWDAGSCQTFWSDRQKEIFGVPLHEPATFDLWRSALHPDDAERVLETVSGLHDPASGGQLRLEHRIVRPSGEVRWILARGQMLYEIVEGGLKARRLLGTVLDITDRKRAEEERQVLVRELNHRVKNLFAVASGMVSLTARSAANPQEMGIALRGRLEALSRAHGLIQPAVGGSGVENQTALMADLMRAVLAPYQETGRLSLQGERLRVGPNAATTLTLVMHEMATNAVKYGALSSGTGHLAIAWQRDDDAVVLTWQETGGPAILKPPAHMGFGSQLTRKSITGQLGGTLVQDWRPEGLFLTLTLPSERLER